MIKEKQEEFERIGARVGSIVTHSARKGAVTHAVSRCTVSPIMASICNMAQWKMGGTRDKYIKFENVGNKFQGRSLIGLNSLHREFSFYPPYFIRGAMALEGIDGLLYDHVIGGGTLSAPLFKVLWICALLWLFTIETILN